MQKGNVFPARFFVSADEKPNFSVKFWIFSLDKYKLFIVAFIAGLFSLTVRVNVCNSFVASSPALEKVTNVESMFIVIEPNMPDSI